MALLHKPLPAMAGWRCDGSSNCDTNDRLAIYLDDDADRPLIAQSLCREGTFVLDPEYVPASLIDRLQEKTGWYTSRKGNLPWLYLQDSTSTYDGGRFRLVVRTAVLEWVMKFESTGLIAHIEATTVDACQPCKEGVDLSFSVVEAQRFPLRH